MSFAWLFLALVPLWQLLDIRTPLHWRRVGQNITQFSNLALLTTNRLMEVVKFTPTTYYNHQFYRNPYIASLNYMLFFWCQLGGSRYPGIFCCLK